MADVETHSLLQLSAWLWAKLDHDARSLDWHWLGADYALVLDSTAGRRTPRRGRC